jgi:formylmethanofuran dehydrogenase subunit A
LKDRGHLAAGALADIAVYSEQRDKAAMFRSAAHVFKNGLEVVREGRVIEQIFGRAFAVDVTTDAAMTRRLADYTNRIYGVGLDMFTVVPELLGRPEPFGRVPCGR